MRDKTMENTDDLVRNIYYSQHPSLRKLTSLEKKYLLAVEHGDAATVRRILLMKKREPSIEVDVNCKDPVGRSAMLMAIDNENLEMLKLLIEFSVETSDALLHAINAQYVEAVELLLDHEELVHMEGELHSWEKVESDISSFPPEISPLILAAHKDNYEILKLLLDRGATLPMPHDVRCLCKECCQAMQDDCLCHSRSRINAYRALSSPSLICLSSIDPILTAFELSWELKRLSRAENEFKEDYQKLRIRCQDFATALLAQIRSSKELSVILTHDPIRPPPQDIESLPLTRVEMAVKYRQKKFIAHPNVQQLMSKLWYDGLPGFRQMNSVQQLWEIIKIGVLFPLYAIHYMLFPHSAKGKLIRKPFFKFILHSFSYLFFLFLLTLASQRVETVLVQLFGTERMKVELIETLKKQRGQPPTIIETSILIFIIAHIWQETRELWKKGIVEYFQNMWNVIDFTRNLLHVGTAALRLLAYIQAQAEIRENPMAVYLPREAWDAFDPMLIADGLFAAGNVFAALKLVHIFSINPYLGPLQISLGRMLIDIIKFFFIYTLVLFAFACGLNQLLWYYADAEKKLCFTGPGGKENWVQQRDACLAWRRFSNLFESSQTLFWATFGLVDLSTFELTGIKTYTRFWGLLMFGSYSVINVVVLLNLLIAMMSNSYQLISERADEEWKFARTKLFMNYFEEGGTVPPPFNVFPTFKNIVRLLNKKDLRKNLSFRKKEMKAKERDAVYQSVMCNLVWRYVTAQQKACETDAVTEDHIKEVRQDVSSFRHDLMHVLRCNGMNTKGIELNRTDVSPGKIQIRKRRLINDFSIGLMEVCAEDAAPEIRGNKSVLARLVGLSAPETGGGQRWRDLIQLAKKSKIIGRTDSPTWQSSTVSDDEDGGKDQTSNSSVKMDGQNELKSNIQSSNDTSLVPDADMTKTAAAKTQMAQANVPFDTPNDFFSSLSDNNSVVMSKSIARPKSLLQKSTDNFQKQDSPRKMVTSHPTTSKNIADISPVQKSVSFETKPKVVELKSSPTEMSGKKNKSAAPLPPSALKSIERTKSSIQQDCKDEVPRTGVSAGMTNPQQVVTQISRTSSEVLAVQDSGKQVNKTEADPSSKGNSSITIDVPFEGDRRSESRSKVENQEFQKSENSVFVSIHSPTGSMPEMMKIQKSQDGIKSSIPVPQKKQPNEDKKDVKPKTVAPDIEGCQHGWI